MDSNNFPLYFLYFVSYPSVEFNLPFYGAALEPQTVRGEFMLRQKDQNLDMYSIKSRTNNEDIDAIDRGIEE